MAPKPEKSESGSISCKHGTEGLHGKNNWSVPTFFRSGRIFSCSVNGARVSSYQLWFQYSTCLDTRQPGSVFKKLDTRQS